MSNLQLNWQTIAQKINPIFIPYLKNKDRHLILYGGAGSGKSVFAVQKIILRIIYEKKHRVFVLRKYGNTHRQSTFSLFKRVLTEWGLSNYFHVHDTRMEIQLPFFGSSIYFVGLDDTKKLLSTDSISIIWIEECSEITIPSDYDLINTRLRGRVDDGIDRQIISTFNPIDERHWLKRKFFDDPPPNSTWLKTTYLDNAFIDEQYKQVLENDFKNNENYYRIFVKGEWGRISNGGEFYKYFSLQKHIVKNLDYDDELPLHITFDFNVLPFVACLVWQIVIKGNEKYAYCVDEICLPPPHNRTLNVCQEIKRRYQNHKSGLYIYGDPAGRAESTKTASNINDFTIIQKELSGFALTPKIMTKPLPPKARALFIDACFYGETNLKILINSKCNNSINEYLYLQEGEDGLKLKKKVKNKELDKSYEEFGHISDANEYFLTVAFYNDFALFHTKNEKAISQTKITYLQKNKMSY